MTKTNIQILNYLIEKYYLKKCKQKTVSSHWENYNKHFMDFGKDIFHKYRSVGVSNFTTYNYKKFIFRLPRKIYLFYLILKFRIKIQKIKKLHSICKELRILAEFNQIKLLIILDKIEKHINLNRNIFICIIGDGYGFLGSLITKLYPNTKLLFVNIGENLILDYYYFNIINKKQKKILLDYKTSSIQNGVNYYFLESDNYELIKNLPIKLFISICSMQEMENKVINKYFEYIRSSLEEEKYIYCCNRIEKKLPNGEIVRFKEYPWKKADKEIFYENATFHKFYPVSTPPFFKKFAGELLHKLIKV